MKRCPRSSNNGNNSYKRYKENKVILPIFKPSGLLELESHIKNGKPIKHIKPEDATSPTDYWQKHNILFSHRSILKLILYEQDVKQPVKEITMNDKSYYTVGSSNRNTKNSIPSDVDINDIDCDDLICLVQFREISDNLEPFILSFDESKKVLVNDVSIPTARYIRLHSEDVITFSTEVMKSHYELVFMSV